MWLSVEGYRIVWRKEVCGIPVPARFQATVRIMLPESKQMWDFTERRLFKTLAKAQESCERHHRLWLQACDATGVRSLLKIFGKLPFGIPLWVRKKLNRTVYEILSQPRSAKYLEEEEREEEENKCLSDHTKTLKTSVESISSGVPTLQTTQSNGLVCSATAEDGITIPTTRRTPSKATKCEDTSHVPPVKKVGAVPVKRSSKRTVKQSRRGKEEKTNTTNLSKSAKRPLKSSRKKKSPPSAC
jgi:hypothetical protein